MNASYDWLKALVPFDLTPSELRDLITARVATVDELVALRADLAPIVVARVVEAQPHPDSDHLSVTRVDAGGAELLDVVCGAPNVTAGKLYPFAPTGTTMPNGLKIERRRIRGQTSNGMLCSARELGLGEEHDGILELDVDVPPGTPFLEAVAVGDTRLVIDVLPNRPDLLSHAGVAREIAAATGQSLRLPPVPVSAEVRARDDMDRQLESVARNIQQLGHSLRQNLGVGGSDARLAGGVHGETVPVAASVRAAESGCRRYVGVTMHGVTVGESPEWLVRRLTAVGARSINNVVDATNYVMHELGQPLHAFDADRLAGRSVEVRQAREGERIVTLDGVERTLTPEMTVIADAAGPQAVAGVMGGQGTEVRAETTTIFLESASFDPRRTRAARRALGLSTDASYRFERSVDPELAPAALQRLVHVIRAVAGGRTVGGQVDINPAPRAERTILLRVSRVTRVLGVPVLGDEIERLLQPVGFGFSPTGDPDVIVVALPSWREDVTIEADLIEEVARLRGYDTIPDEIRPFRPGTVPESATHDASRRIRDALVGAGLLEVRPMPFTGGASEQPHVRVANPLAENEAYLRRSILDTLAPRAEYNLSHMQGDVRLFEIGAVFAPAQQSLPRESLHAAALVMGARRPSHFTDPEPPSFDEWDAKALAETLVGAAWPAALVAVVPAEGEDGDRLWDVVVDGAVVGAVRRVPLDAPIWAAAAFGVEVRLAELSAAPEQRGAVTLPEALRVPLGRGVRFRPLPTTPPAERDLTLLVPDGLPASRVEEVMRRDGGELLEQLRLRGEFRGPGVPDGTRALTWRLTFRHPERTLRDKELDGRQQKLLRTLEGELGVRSRA